jgi:hypothetical protein
MTTTDSNKTTHQSKFNDYIYFVYMGNNASYGFMTYTDHVTGKSIGYVEGYTSNNQPIYKKWKWNNDSFRIVRVGKQQQDLTGQLASEFLRNSPGCKDSPNGTYVNGVQYDHYIKEIKEEADAEKAIEARVKYADALTKALALKGRDLVDVAAILGVHNQKPSVTKYKVVDYASNYPDKFIQLLEDPAIKVRSLVRRAVDGNVFKKDGPMIMWEDKLIGADEDAAVSAILKDEKLRKAVETNLAKFGGSDA